MNTVNNESVTTLSPTKREKTKNDLDSLSDFLLATLNGITNGEISHQKAQDIAATTHVFNQVMVLKTIVCPDDALGVPSSELIEKAQKLVALNVN